MSRKLYLIPLLLLVGSLLLVIPFNVNIATAARLNPKLAAVNNPTSPTNIVLANTNVSIKAGSATVAAVDLNTSYAGYYFAIVFAINSTKLVEFDGATFMLYISKDGFASISPDDKAFGPTFGVNDLYANTLKNVGGYYIGNISIGGTYYSIVIGPIPSDITADYKYIKIFDGLNTQTAVSKETLIILPTLTMSPTSGPACSQVTITGTALRSKAPVTVLVNGQEVASNTTTSDGKLVVTFPMIDTKAAWTGTGAIPYDTLTVEVYYADTNEFIASFTFKEYYRSFVELRSIEYGEVALPFTNIYTGAGNNTLSLNAYNGDTIILAGAWWSLCGQVNISVDNILLTTVTPSAPNGFFNVTIKLPRLAPGGHTVYVVQGDVVYTFTINIILRPAIWIDPTEGPVTTVVNVWGSDFPPNAEGYIIWYGCRGETIVAEFRTDSNGSFATNFTVPADYGGEHTVTACVGTWCASETFTVLPTILVTPEVFPADGREFYVVISGMPAGGVYNPYVVTVDNQFMYWATCDECGTLNLTLIAAGLRPGLHVVAFYSESTFFPASNARPELYKVFAVTCDNDPVCTQLATVIGKLTNIENGLATIQTQLGVIKTALDNLAPVITRIDGNVATLLTRIGYIEANITELKALIESSKTAILTSVQDGVATIQTELGEIKANISALAPVITRIDGNVATIQTTLGTVTADISTIKSGVSDLGNRIISQINSLTTKVNSVADTVSSVNTTTSNIAKDTGDLKTMLSDTRNQVGTLSTKLDDVKSVIDSVKSDLSGVASLSIFIWLAIIFSLISAALAAYVAVTVRKLLYKG